MTARRPGAAAAALLLAAGAAAAHAAPTAAQQPFTIEDVMSAPFPSGLVADPGADRIAWVRNDRGERNVWVAEGPAWTPRRLTAYEGDDGQELGDLTFTPDGRLLFSRGGAANRQGERPNPRSVAAGVETSLWIVPVEGGQPRALPGNDPVLSPDGSRYAWSRGGRILVAGLDGDGEPETVADPRGSPGALAWSPDGTRLAFSSRRGDHAFVGVLELAAGELRWLDPGVDLDGSPAWSPDGRRLAFLRVPDDGGRLPFSPRREAEPWSVRVVDVESGRAREVWRAEPGPGSAFQGVGGPSLAWAAGDRLVFPWEGDGWLHLYSVPASGGAATLLTPGAFEVQFVGLTPDRTRLLYDSNQGDTDRKHVWEVAVDGARPPRLLTPGEGLEWGAVETGAGTLAFLGAGATEPARAFVGRGADRRPLAPLPASFPGDRLVTPRAVVFPASDGMRIHGQLFVPRDLRAGERRPAVLFFHGGSRRQMLLGFHHRGYYHNAYAFNQYLAGLGYVVLSVNYRSGIGYGMAFREALDYGATGASEFADVLGAGLYLASRPDVDPDRIGLWGGSYGGYLTALGLARASDLFAAGVDFHGVHDWNVVIENFVPSYEPEDHPDFAAVALASSPLGDLDGWRSPVLIVHGDDDRNVPFSESVDLAAALRERGVPFELLVLPDEVHGFLLHESWVRAYRASADFLERRLKGAARATDAGR